jgi:flagellar hook-associated protein 3 FlgL
MRISTSGASLAALDAMLNQQAALAKTQSQVASGKSIQTPADDPAGAIHIATLQRAIAASAQYKTNSDAAQTRLSMEEQALADATNTLQNAHDLAIEANNPALDDSTRKQINAQLNVDIQQLQDIANRRDANGEYLFSGNATSTQPFSRNGAGTMVYNGDQQSRQIEVGPGQRVADSHTGQAAFGDVPAGNGTFVTATSATNTGTGQIDAGTVMNPAAWVPGSYTIKFLPGATYEVRDASANLIASGNYQSGNAIQFAGVSVTVTGQPATNDTFSVSAAGKQDVFAALDTLVSTVGRTTANPADRARLSSDLGNSLQQISQALDHLGAVRAEVGARISNLDSLSSTRDALDVQLHSSLSQTQDLDYASAITKMNLQYTGLQAAQAAYAKIGQLSLFNYL